MEESDDEVDSESNFNVDEACDATWSDERNNINNCVDSCGQVCDSDSQ